MYPPVEPRLIQGEEGEGDWARDSPSYQLQTPKLLLPSEDH